MGTATTTVGGFVALTKPRIIELLLVTTVPTMIVAADGWPGTWLVIATLVGGTLAAGGANAINMVVDRDIDRLMPRTQHRPLVTGVVAPGEALVFAARPRGRRVRRGCALHRQPAVGAVLALSATLFYVFVYTLWLKRTSTQNIVIGGRRRRRAGARRLGGGHRVAWPGRRSCCSPSSSSGRRPTSGRWPSATPTTTGGRRADAARGRRARGRAADPMLGYTVALLAASLLLAPVADLGAIYVVGRRRGRSRVHRSGGASSARAPTAANAMRLFTYSITYVTLLFAAMAVDVLVR